MDDKTTLKTSSAGMRLIAQTTIFNNKDFTRLRQYIADNYHDGLLSEIPVSTWLAEMKAVHRLAGKLRVRQVVGISKYQAIVVMESERGGHYLVQITVEEDYPHKVLGYQLSALPEQHNEGAS